MSKQGDRERLARETGFADPNEVAVYDFLRGRGFGDREAQDILAGRAALRSDSPVTCEHCEGDRWVCAGCGCKRDWVDEDHPDLCACGTVTVEPCPFCPASTGGERDEPDTERLAEQFEKGWRAGEAAALEGGVEVEVDGNQKVTSLSMVNGVRHSIVAPGEYVLLPRPQVGDPNDNGG